MATVHQRHGQTVRRKTYCSNTVRCTYTLCAEVERDPGRYISVRFCWRFGLFRVSWIILQDSLALADGVN